MNNRNLIIGLAIAVTVVGIFGLCVVAFIAASMLNVFGGGQLTQTPVAQATQPGIRTPVVPTLPAASIATRPSQSPTASLRAGSVNDLQIVKKGMVQCRPSPNNPQTVSDFWGVWEIRNTRKDLWVKSLQAETRLIGSGGLVLSTYSLETSSIAADTIDWLVTPGLDKNQPLSGGGSKVVDIGLDFTNLSWAPVDDSASKYKYDIALVGHEEENTAYPRHTFTVSVSNNSDFLMKNINIFGAFFDSHGNLVDMAWLLNPRQNERDIPFGQARTFVIPSVSQSGRCVGPRDTAGYTLDYWVSFGTYTGQGVTRYFTTQVK